MTDGDTDRQATPIAFAPHLAASGSFKALFDDGIALIEETAAYLDDEGRASSRMLTSQDKLTYATLSMKLTTRLMSLASWLLVQRAVNEGEMSPETGRAEHAKVKLGTTLTTPDGAQAMPGGLIALFGRCADLQARVQRLDEALGGPASVPHGAGGNAVAAQLGVLENAFR